MSEREWAIPMGQQVAVEAEQRAQAVEVTPLGATERHYICPNGLRFTEQLEPVPVVWPAGYMRDGGEA